MSTCTSDQHRYSADGQKLGSAAFVGIRRGITEKREVTDNCVALRQKTISGIGQYHGQFVRETNNEDPFITAFKINLINVFRQNIRKLIPTVQNSSGSKSKASFRLIRLFLLLSLSSFFFLSFFAL